MASTPHATSLHPSNPTLPYCIASHAMQTHRSGYWKHCFNVMSSVDMFGKLPCRLEHGDLGKMSQVISMYIHAADCYK